MNFIVIEGDNGTGKDTQALKLAERLNCDVVTNYDNIKKLNLEAKMLEGKERVKKFLEYNNYISKCVSTMESSIVVRYWVSTLAAAYADNIFTLDEISKLEEEFCSSLKRPDIILCLWCEYNDRVKRINERQAEGFDDITESRNVRYAWFLNYMKEKCNLNWVDINTTNKSIDEVAEEIFGYVNKVDSNNSKLYMKEYNDK